MHNETGKPLELDLTGIEMEEIKIFFQEGARGGPEMSASCAITPFPCFSCGSSCSAPEPS